MSVMKTSSNVLPFAKAAAMISFTQLHSWGLDGLVYSIVIQVWN